MRKYISRRKFYIRFASHLCKCSQCSSSPEYIYDLQPISIINSRVSIMLNCKQIQSCLRLLNIVWPINTNTHRLKIQFRAISPNISCCIIRNNRIDCDDLFHGIAALSGDITSFSGLKIKSRGLCCEVASICLSWVVSSGLCIWTSLIGHIASRHFVVSCHTGPKGRNGK